MENFEEKNKKDRQLDNLINLVENHTRTKRHLEQYSNIGNEENKNHARKIQDVREEQINDLKNKLNNEDNIQNRKQQIENLERKLKKTQGYIENNKDGLNEQMIQEIENKQNKRKEQLENLNN